MFPASSKGGGQCLAFPDVCKVPAPPAPFVPVPFPNISMVAQASGTASKVKICGKDAVTKSSDIGRSQGDEAGTLRLFSIHGATGEDQLHGLRLTDSAGQALGSAHSRNYAQVDFWLAELRSVGGQDEVAHHRDLASSAERIPGDGGDHRRAHGCKIVPG